MLSKQNEKKDLLNFKNAASCSGCLLEKSRGSPFTMGTCNKEQKGNTLPMASPLRLLSHVFHCPDFEHVLSWNGVSQEHWK